MFKIKKTIFTAVTACVMAGSIMSIGSTAGTDQASGKYTVYAAGEDSQMVETDILSVKKTAVTSKTRKNIKNGWCKQNKKWYYYKNNKKQKKKLITITERVGGVRKKNTYYLKADGSVATGLLRVKGKLYYFSTKGTNHPGAAISGWKTVKGKRYYFSKKNHAAVSGAVRISGRTYYFSVRNNGMIKGLVRIGSDKMYFSMVNGTKVTGRSVRVGKNTYYFGNDGKAVTGLHKIGGYYYYFDQYGAMRTNVWIKIKGRMYRFANNGHAYIGFHKIDGSRYYFKVDGQMMRSSFKKIKGETYYFCRSGKSVTGLKKINDKYYYFTSKGVMVKNKFVSLSGKKYYFGSNGAAYTGVKKVNGSKYYYNFSSRGYLTGGARRIGGQLYRFKEDGTPYTGWYTTDLGNEQYYKMNGTPYKGSARIDGKLYVFDENGALIHGNCWVHIGDDTYYLGKDESPVTGYRNIDGDYYHFGDDGKMYRNKWGYADGYKFYFGDDGKRLIDVDSILGKQDTYEITINKTRNVVTVYASDGDNGFIIPVKAFVCSGGDTTPLGTFYTPAKGRWWTLMGPCYGQWDTLITGDILFHSVFYGEQDPATLSVSAYNQLGTTCSHGCVRLKAGDAKWIYDNCELGTKVTIFESDNDGPFPKPTSVQLDYSHTWDPTDPTMAYKCKENGCHKGIAW